MFARNFVERTGDLALLAAAAATARNGRGGVITIAGEPGIGKTRLADEASEQARSDGMLVAWGRAWEAGGAPAFWPWVQIIRALSRAGFDPPSALSRILPEDVSAEPPLALGADRFTLFDAVLRHLATAATRRPLFLVLDDLHAADAPSLALTDFLAPALMDLPVMLVATYRDVEARLSQERGDLLARLSRSGHALRPARLSRAAVLELAAAAGRDFAAPFPADAVEDLFRMSEGNPLFVAELLQVMRSPVERGWQSGNGRATGPVIPDSVRAAIRAHLARLPDDLRAPLDVAAVIGREFTATALADVLEPRLELDVIVARLAAASSAGVLAEPTPMRFAFAHALFREVLYADLGARRLSIHRRVAETLERLHGDNPAAPLAEIAAHWFAAGPASAARARDTAVRAADRAAAALAHEEAVELLERALQAHEQAEPGKDSVRVALLIALADAQTRAGDVSGGRLTSVSAATLARDLGDALAFARAALSRGAMMSPGYVDPELVAMLEEARARLAANTERTRPVDACCTLPTCAPDAALEARVLARLAAAKQPARDPRGPVALARDAIALLPEVCAEVRLSVLHAAMGAMMDISHPLERRPLNEEAAQIAAAIGEREILFRTLLRLFFDHVEVGDLEAAEARIAEADALARSFPRASSGAPVALGRSVLALLRGDDVGHEASVAEARRLAEADPSFSPVLLIHEIGSDRMRGRTDALAARRDEAVSILTPWTNLPEAFDASLAARRGDAEAAEAALARIDRVHLKTCLDTLLLAWVAEGAAAAKDAEVGAIVDEALAVHAGEWTSVSLPGFIVEGPVAVTKALAAQACGRIEDARRLRQEALEEARRAGATGVVARLVRMDHEDPLPPPAAFDSGQSASQARVPESPAASFVLEGEYWTVKGQGGVVRLRNSRGLSMLARLVAEPGHEIAALDLESPKAFAIVDAGDAGELLDESARAAYRRRLVELEEELVEAEAWNDPERLARARGESDALRAELARAVGLGGRTRRAGAAAERARVNVQRRITDAIHRIHAHDAALGEHLARAVRTGAYSSYLPERARR